MSRATPPNLEQADRQALDLVAHLVGGHQTHESVTALVEEMIDGHTPLEIGRSLLVTAVTASVAVHGWANEADLDPLDVLMDADTAILTAAS